MHSSNALPANLFNYNRSYCEEIIQHLHVELLQAETIVQEDKRDLESQALEVCFRRGFLTVVVTTGTLSLGIDMPCKTVVLSGDCVYLTVLNFQQALGRAGCRGFDLLGNVVFQGIGVDKVAGYLVSRLPDLNGHAPFTTSFVSATPRSLAWDQKMQTTRCKWSIPYYHIPGSILVTMAFATRFCIVSDSRLSICARRV